MNLDSRCQITPKEVIFAADSDVKEVACRLGINEENLSQCFNAFRAADADGSGTLDFTELVKLLHELQGDEALGEAEIEHINARFKNDSGVLDFSDFLEAFCSTKWYKSQHIEEMLTSVAQTTLTELGKDRQVASSYKIRYEGVPVEYVMAYLESEVDQMKACMSLPGVLLLFLSFLLSITWHLRIDIMHGHSEAIIFDLEENANFAFSEAIPFEAARAGHKAIYDVNNYGDFWSWMNLGLVPLLWIDSWATGEHRVNAVQQCGSHFKWLQGFGWDKILVRSASNWSSNDCTDFDITPETVSEFQGKPPTPVYLWYNSMVGGVRMQQEQSPRKACTNSDRYGLNLYTGVCLDVPDYWIAPEPPQNLATDDARTNREGGETVFLLTGGGHTQASARQVLRELENRAWFSPLASKVELLFTVYNPHIDMIIVTHINFFVNGAGHIYKMIDSVGFWLEPYHGWWCYVADILWVVLVLKIFLEEGAELVQQMYKKGPCKGMMEYITLANFVDWCNVGWSCAIAVNWINHLGEVAQLKDYLEQASVSVAGSWSDEETRNSYFEHVHDMTRSWYWRKMMFAGYPFVLVCRLFKALSAQPRLALVTNTIHAAGKDLVHFGLVFCSVFLLFTASATILFGEEMVNFSTFARAADTSFHVLIGDVPWEEMQKIGRLPAMIWFASFIWLLELVMFNMLLAIVMDFYTETRGTLGDNAETLWSQSWELYTRWKDVKSGRGMTLSHITACLESDMSFTDGDADQKNARVITLKALMNDVPGLGEPQATRILQGAVLLESNKRESIGITEAIQRIGNITNRVSSVIRMVDMCGTLMMQRLTQDQQAPQEKDVAEPQSHPRSHLQLEAFTERFNHFESRLDTLETHMATLAKGQQQLLDLQQQQLQRRQSKHHRTPSGVAEADGPSLCNVSQVKKPEFLVR